MEPEKKIARLAIGMEGGFNPDANKKRYEYEETNSVVILPQFEVIEFPNVDLPEIVSSRFSFRVTPHHFEKRKLFTLFGLRFSENING